MATKKISIIFEIAEEPKNAKYKEVNIGCVFTHRNDRDEARLLFAIENVTNIKLLTADEKNA